MTAYFKRHRWAVLAIALLLLVPLAVLADQLWEGVDNDPNKKTGDIVYCRLMSFDGTYWDRVINSARKADDDDTGACHVPQVASADHTLTAAGWHTVSCTGNSCPIMCGASPTAGTAANAHFIKIPDGAAYRLYLTGPVCAYIAGNGVATGEICFTYEGL